MQPKINLEKKDRGPKIGEYLLVILSLKKLATLVNDQKMEIYNIFLFMISILLIYYIVVHGN
jgi:hypothetical protein